jgi:imidazole glycerol-phosphate synthase subunit HisH
MVGIVDYGMGNLLSVYNAVEMVGGEATICRTPEALKDVDRIILPGVGAFRDCIANLRQQGFVEALEEEVLGAGKPFFGICLGMQALARRSYEGGVYEGLGWIEGDVVRLEPGDAALRVPQVGWNDLDYHRTSPMFARLPPVPDFYFVHSYYLKCDHDAQVEATCDYGGPVTAAVHKDNIFATQFHPEKSQDHGLTMLENFMRWDP